MIVRGDVPRGVQAAMIAHAAGESSTGCLPEGTFAFVLQVPNEDSLRAVAKRLENAGVRLVLIEEPDAPWNGEAMAIGVVPARKEDLRRHLSSLPLLR